MKSCNWSLFIFTEGFSINTRYNYALLPCTKQVILINTANQETAINVVKSVTSTIWDSWQNDIFIVDIVGNII